MSEKKAPVLKGYVKGSSLNVWCPSCRKWHYHGSGSKYDGIRIITEKGDPFGEGHRVEHCSGKVSPYPKGYIVKVFTKAELRDIVEFAASRGIVTSKFCLEELAQGEEEKKTRK